MHDLMGVTRHDELAGHLERFEHQRELHRGQILHFIDGDEVVPRAHSGQERVGDEVGLVERRAFKPLAPRRQHPVQPGALLGTEDGLADAQGQVLLERQDTRGLGGDDPPQLLETLVGVGEREAPPVTLEESSEVPKEHRPARGHRD